MSKEDFESHVQKNAIIHKQHRKHSDGTEASVVKYEGPGIGSSKPEDFMVIFNLIKVFLVCVLIELIT